MIYSKLLYLTTRVVYGILYHDYFSFILVYLEIMLLELFEAKNKILLTQPKYCKQSLL